MRYSAERTGSCRRTKRVLPLAVYISHPTVPSSIRALRSIYPLGLEDAFLWLVFSAKGGFYFAKNKKKLRPICNDVFSGNDRLIGSSL